MFAGGHAGLAQRLARGAGGCVAEAGAHEMRASGRGAAAARQARVGADAGGSGQERWRNGAARTAAARSGSSTAAAVGEGY